MTALIDFSSRVAATMSSREIAQETGKRHDHVLRDCDNLNENYAKIGLPKLGESSYINEQGRSFREVLLSKMQTWDLMTGYDAALRIKVNRRWEELENAKPKEIESPEDIMARALLIAKQTMDRQSMEIQVLESKNSLLEEISDEQHRQIEAYKPKAIFADAVAHSKGSILVGALAKILSQKGVDIGQNRLFEWMRSNGYLCRVGKNHNIPTQKAMEMGLFEISETAVLRSEGTMTMITPYVTGKGQQYFVNKFINQTQAAIA